MPLTRQEQQEEVGSSHGYTTRRAGLVSGDSWRKRREQAVSRATTPGLQSPLLLPRIQPGEGGIWNRSQAGGGSWSLGPGGGDYFGRTSSVPDGPLGVQVPRDSASNLAPELVLTNRPYPALLTKWTFLILYQPCPCSPCHNPCPPSGSALPQVSNALILTPGPSSGLQPCPANIAAQT